MPVVTIYRTLDDWLRKPPSLADVELNPHLEHSRSVPAVIGRTKYRLQVQVGPAEKEVIIGYCLEALSDEQLTDAQRAAIEQTQRQMEAVDVGDR